MGPIKIPVFRTVKPMQVIAKSIGCSLQSDSKSLLLKITPTLHGVFRILEKDSVYYQRRKLTANPQSTIFL